MLPTSCGRSGTENYSVRPVAAVQAQLPALQRLRSIVGAGRTHGLGNIAVARDGAWTSPPAAGIKVLQTLLETVSIP
jgi:hypothetical protein